MPDVAVCHGPPGSAAVAAGSWEVVRACVEVLRAGGGAVDAVLAGAFASAVAEPALSSLGGGGFLLHAAPGEEPAILDFFVAVPGLAGEPVSPRVTTVVVDFAKAGPAAQASEQIFHADWGTVAVPGCLVGYLDAHHRWGRLALDSVLAPAIELAREGVHLSAVQRQILGLVAEPLELTAESRQVFGDAVERGFMVNPQYADLLVSLAAGGLRDPADPNYAGRMLAASRTEGGLLTSRDLDAYVATDRAPLHLERSGVGIWTNPPPSVGGSIVLDALQRTPREGGVDWSAVASGQAAASHNLRGPGQVPTGTTHVSVVDPEGAFASITTSNGSGSGTVVPGWGVALNNMLGEEDLHAGAPLSPGARMGSMMAPTLLRWPDGAHVLLGTGGSERIRSATLCVVARMVDAGQDLASAVRDPRVHVGGDDQLHVEPGLDEADVVGLEHLAQSLGWPAVARWPTPNLFFGGVHAVRRDGAGAVTAVGDARRGGAAAVLRPDGRLDSARSRV